MRSPATPTYRIRGEGTIGDALDDSPAGQHASSAHNEKSVEQMPAFIPRPRTFVQVIYLSISYQNLSSVNYLFQKRTFS